MSDREDLVKGISEVINRLSRENESDTPDFILAEHAVKAIESLEVALKERGRWYASDA